MVIKIEFLKNNSESTLPIIQLTKSRNKSTGTASFIFIKPKLFSLVEKEIICLTTMALIWENKKIITNDICVKFYKGKPFLIKSIFVFKNSFQWFEFLNFMQYYSNEIGLAFTTIK